MLNRIRIFFFGVVVVVTACSHDLHTVQISDTTHVTKCKEHYANGIAPKFIKEGLKYNGSEFCYQGYAVFYSTDTKTPIYAAEKLTCDSLSKAGKLKRKVHFPSKTLFADSVYDRGHMAPSADMPTYESQGESFLMVNVIPQNRSINRGKWSRVEDEVRKLVLGKDGICKREELFVVTGIINTDKPKKVGGVSVPAKIYKAVYDPKGRISGAYIAANKQGARVVMMSIKELEGIICKGFPSCVNIFPCIGTEGLFIN